MARIGSAATLLVLVAGLVPPARAEDISKGQSPKPENGIVASIRALEEAYRQQPLPGILVNIAVLHEQAADCRNAIEAFRRFFESCKSCDIMNYGVERFNLTIERCVKDIDEEVAIRESVSITRGSAPKRLPGDATKKEVVDLLREARTLDPGGVASLFSMLVEAGDDVTVPLLNEVRKKAWEILLRQEATPEQVTQLLQRLKLVDFNLFQELIGRLNELKGAEDSKSLQELRRSALYALQTNSSGPTSRRPTAGCSASFEREWGFVTVNTIPWSDVYVNGEKYGSTPVSRAVVLAGCATIRAVSPETGREVIKNVTIRPNKNAILVVNMTSGTDELSYR